MDRDQDTSDPLNLDAWFAAMSERLITPPSSGEPEPELLVTEHAMYIPVSDELLMDCGAMPDTREHKPIPWRTRLRWRLGEKRERTAELAYRLIAGHDVPEPD
jgi:hypothetical protein